MILLSGSSNRPFAQKVADAMGQPLGETELGEFKNGERRVYIKEAVKGHDIALIQSFSDPADSHIIEFALMTDALFRLGARRVFAVIPWFGYSMQDKVFRPGEPIGAKVVASMLSSQSIYRFILMHLHNNSMQGFFSVPSSVLASDSVFEEEIRKYEDAVLVSSDFGSLKHVGKLADALHLPYASIDKRRDLKTGKVETRSIAGEVEGKTAIMIDDNINAGGTTIEASKILRANGAKKIIMMATHGIFAGNACQDLQASEVDEVVVTDTIDNSDKRFEKLRVVSVAQTFATELQQWAR